MTYPSFEEQRTTALAKANRIRIARREFKRDLKCGFASLVPTLLDQPEWMDSALVHVFISALPLFGPIKATELMKKARVAPHWRFRQLTPRQREALAELVREVEQ